MYYHVFRKSFSRYERKRFGYYALFLCFIVAFGISSTFKPHLHPLSLIDAVNMQLLINAGEDMLMNDHSRENSNPTVGNAAEDLQLLSNAAEDLQLLSNAAENTLVVNDTNTIFQPTAIEKKKKVEVICRNSNYCEIEGDIRIDANSSTIFVVAPLESISNSTNSWIIEPYPRKGTSRVKNWTVSLVGHKNHDHSIPKCTQNHSHPAILFSVGGFSGNFFHDFADVLFPLYSTSFHFRKEVHFLASDYKSWWISKFRQILYKLTRNNILDIDREKLQVHCYNNMVAGLKFHKELIIHPSLSNSPSGLSMHGFRLLLGQAYSLERKMAIRSRKGDRTRPRLMIISRKHTRIITNEGEVSRLARKLGFEVVVAEAGVSTNLSRFAETVNSCDVLMGIHGAGLTNMVFLPDNAVLIQIVPFGGIDGFARLDFGNPASGMKIRYLEYKIKVKESSLFQNYPIDHPILKDPKSFKGWNALWSIYLDKQNVTIDLHRFKGTLAKALKLLRH